MGGIDHSKINHSNISINLSIINQPKISILFVSYLRIGRMDFGATSGDYVVLSLLCRMVQSARIFIERKSRKVDNKGKSD
jgi:hypothetical protein